jgi:hypothetical protein
MLFAFIEDGTLEVIADLAEARRRFEPIDVESAVVAFYDERGRPLTAVFPNRSERRFLGLRVSPDPGPYELELNRDTTAEPIETALLEVAALTPNPWFSTLDDAKAYLTTSRSAGAS